MEVLIGITAYLLAGFVATSILYALVLGVRIGFRVLKNPNRPPSDGVLGYLLVGIGIPLTVLLLFPLFLLLFFSYFYFNLGNIFGSDILGILRMVILTASILVSFISLRKGEKYYWFLRNEEREDWQE